MQVLRTDRNVILLLAAAGIAAWLLIFQIVDGSRDLRGGDADYYLRVADNLLHNGVHSERPDALPADFRPPGYPAFLAVILSFGAGSSAAIAFQSLLILAASLLTFWTLRLVDRVLAIGSALLVATSPFLILYEFVLISEVLYVTLVWVAWLFLFTSLRSGMAPAIAAGILLGLAILTRDTVLLLPLFALPFAAFLANRGRAVMRLTAAALAAYLIVLPWPLRNATLPDGQFEISDGRFGLNLWVGTWERNSDWVLPGLQNPAFPAYAFRNGVEERILRDALHTADDAPFRKAAFDRIRSEPWTVLRTWVRRYAQLWIGTRSDQIALRPARGTIPWRGLKAALFAMNLAFLVLGAAGMLLALKRRSQWSLFVVPVLYTALFYVPFHNTETRYSLVALPFIYLFAALFVIHFVARRKALPAA
ncbi:MAG: glycosyltransferase family 39 protein [Sphingomicrobium sp.]